MLNFAYSVIVINIVKIKGNAGATIMETARHEPFSLSVIIIKLKYSPSLFVRGKIVDTFTTIVSILDVCNQANILFFIDVVHINFYFFHFIVSNKEAYLLPKTKILICIVY